MIKVERRRLAGGGGGGGGGDSAGHNDRDDDASSAITRSVYGVLNQRGLEAHLPVVFIVGLIVLRAGLALLVLGVLDEHAQVLRQLLELLQMLAGTCAGRLVPIIEELVGVPLDVLDAARQLLVLLHCGCG